MAFRRSLGLVTAGLNQPFGYTLSVWSAGALAISHYGAPQPLEVFLFLGGAIAAYLLLAGYAEHYWAPVMVIHVRAATVFNVIALLVAVVVNLVVALITDPALGYFVAGGLATGVYTLALTLLIDMDDRYHFSRHFARHEQAEGPPDGDH